MERDPALMFSTPFTFSVAIAISVGILGWSISKG